MKKSILLSILFLLVISSTSVFAEQIGDDINWDDYKVKRDSNVPKELSGFYSIDYFYSSDLKKEVLINPDMSIEVGLTMGVDWDSSLFTQFNFSSTLYFGYKNEPYAWEFDTNRWDFGSDGIDFKGGISLKISLLGLFEKMMRTWGGDPNFSIKFKDMTSFRNLIGLYFSWMDDSHTGETWFDIGYIYNPALRISFEVMNVTLFVEFGFTFMLSGRYGAGPSTDPHRPNVGQVISRSYISFSVAF